MIFIYRVCLCLMLLVSVAQADELGQLLQQGQQNIASGYYREAESQLLQAQHQATAQNKRDILILIHSLQGYLALQRQHDNEAEQLLNTALQHAKQATNHDLITRISLYLGQLYEYRRDPQQARFYFQQAIAQPEKVSEKALLVSGYYQLAKLAIDNNQVPLAAQQLEQASVLTQNLPDSPTNSQLWLNIGYQALKLHQLAPENNVLNTAFTSLNTALMLAKQQQQPRIQAAALKYLAHLYQQQQRDDEAIKLLQQGIQLAQQIDASDLLIDLAWQIGQLYQAQHADDLAVAAYRQAVNHIEHIRIDIPISYQNGRSSFRDSFEGIYLALIDLLLRQSDKVSGAQQQQLLAEARDNVERMRKSDLEDYFQSRCDSVDNAKPLQKADKHIAALYPVLLPDRLEIILYSAEGLQHFTSPITGNAVEQQARLLAKDLRSYASFSRTKIHAQLLHRWLMQPITAYLQQRHIDTLIYIPDGVLRLVPLATLYDGKKFVIEDYAIVTSAGLSLMDNGQHTAKNRLLLAGISTPGSVVSDLPDVLLSNLMVKKQPQNSNHRELSVAEQQSKTRELRELLRTPVMQEKLQHLLSLPGVDVEIKQLAEQHHANYLLNEKFSLENFIQQLKVQPHDILHIASHGFFAGTVDDSFIMTYDKILTLNQLEVLLSSAYFKQSPIDLLVLSACQTAEGDDRSPLGISGVAVKTKVYSALGSLWAVSDNATAQLMTAFYSALNQDQQTKAKSLQQAMLRVLKQKDFTNPSYWSPFILIGDGAN